jgi:hypothetical protein
MRTLLLAMGFVAFAATPAIAQVTTGSVSTGTATSSPTTTGTAPRAITTDSSARAVRDQDSTTTTGTTTTGTTTTGTTTTGTTTTGAVTTGAPTTATTGGTTAGVSNVVTNPNAFANATNPFGPNGSFTNDSGNSALGTSPGQTSSGTAAGNSSNGFATDSSTLGVSPLGVATVVPDNVSVIGGGTTGGGFVSVVPPAPQQSQSVTIAPPTRTPLFDQAAREGREKEARRRARGDEPRVYGIAPNTERDLTWQMPDDRIIRY